VWDISRVRRSLTNCLELLDDFVFSHCDHALLDLRTGNSVIYVDNRVENEKPQRGTHVDSISYYMHDLAECNKVMYFMQQRKSEIAISGNLSFEADNWLARVVTSANVIADQIIVDSANDNGLRARGSLFYHLSGGSGAIPQAEQSKFKITIKKLSFWRSMSLHDLSYCPFVASLAHGSDITLWVVWSPL
jgi:hypothetical protein